jgi:hypothetical protein
VSSSREELLRFIAATFPSVWALELLLALKREARPCTRDELVTLLRASDLVVARALDALLAAGLVSVEQHQAVYQPANASLEDCVQQVEQLYRSRANVVRRSIIATASSGATAFANAFKLRRDGDD